MRSTTNGLTTEQIRKLPLFQPLDAQSLDQIGRQARPVALGRGEVLIKRGMELHGMYSILSGQLKIYLLSCGGDERIVRLLQPGDSFGEAIMFNDIPSPVYVQALNSCDLVYFPKESITETLIRRPGFTFAMLRSMSKLMRELISDVENCCLRNARQRLIHYLLHQAQLNPTPNNEIQLNCSKASIASFLNLSAETFSRELHQLAHEGLIAIDRRIIHLRDKPALERSSRELDASG